jgi:hypothetical protein
MARLFVFAIGGTGSRVLKSLTMLLAAGVKPSSGNFEIVPIIIDPHKASDAMKQTVQLMDKYQKIAREGKCKNGFFGTTISTLENIIASENKLADNFVFNLQEVSNTKFRDYIEFDQLDEANRSLVDVLFSGSSINKRHEKIDLLDVEMDIGFVGNPNIGSVVLNQFKDSDEFREFANNFNEGDRIFIVSSIFGGTGAAGFPTILKNIRGAKKIKNISSQGFLEDAPIGAITVLPYFNLEADEKSPIQRAEFISKTRSALYYYKNNVSGNNSVNALYYIGDDFSGKPYKNDPGDGGQPNDAHFIELAAALSIIDFLEIPSGDLQSKNGKAVRPIYKEFSIRSNEEIITFSHLQENVQRKINVRLAQLALFKKYLNEQMADSCEKSAVQEIRPYDKCASFQTDIYIKNSDKYQHPI